MMRAPVVMVVVLMGCGDNNPSPPPAGGVVAFLHQNVRIGDFAFPPTAAAAHASAMFVIRNDTDATLAPIATALGGDPSFAIDATLSTCVAGLELVPHDLCTVFVRWTAAAAAATTQLVVTSGGVVSILTVRGPVGVTSAVVADASAIDFGVVPVGSSVMINVHVTNTSDADIPISEFGGAVFRFGGNECPLSDDVPVVPARGGCNVGITFEPTAPGWVEEKVGFGDGVVTFDAYRANARTINKLGTGTGRIHSVPSGIDCGTDCGSQSAYLIGDTTLYEEPDDGTRFAGWQSLCGTDPACSVPEQGDIYVGATFAGPGSAAVALTFAGTAAGEMLLGSSSTTTGGFTELTRCSRSCTTYVPVGSPLDIYAVTPSRFNGWTGDCSGGDGHCMLQSVAGDSAATATFDKDEREIVTLLPDGMIPQAVAFASDGDLVIAGGNVVTKLGIDGTVQWSTSSNSDAGQQVAELAITTAGDVFTYGTRFERRSMTGTVLASDPTGPPTCAFHGLTVDLRPALLSAPNGDLGIFSGGTVDGQATNELYVLAPDGSTRFTIDLGAGCTTAVAVGPDGVYQVLSGDQPEDTPTSFHVLRYDASGTQLPTSGPYAMIGGSPSLAIDGVGALAFNIGSVIGRILPDGQVAFTAPNDDDTGSMAKIAYDAAGNVIATHELPGGVSGVHLEQRSPTGAMLWTLDKQPGQFFPGFSLSGVATSRTRQVAVVGKYTAFTGAIDVEVGWVAVYQMP